jgi:hypothetical protein
MNKKIFLFVLALATLSAFGARAQVRIGGISNPHGSAILDLNATDATDNGAKGLALPRVALTATTATAPVTSPIKGLQVYNTATAGSGATAVVPGVYYWDGAKWVGAATYSDATTASNGLTEVGDDIQLGGTLTKATSINQGSYDLTTSGTGKFVISNPLQISSGTPGANKVLTSDASGNATWTTPATPATVNDAALTATINGTLKTFTANSATAVSLGTIYAPTTSGTSGQILQSNGSGAAPTWTNAPSGGITVEVDGVIGNEVLDATSGGGLTRAGSGTTANPYTLGIATGGVTNAMLAANAVTSDKIQDGTITGTDIANATIGGDKLNAGSGSNGQVLTTNGSGGLSWTTVSSGSASPWNVQTTSTAATANTQNIYQSGNVAIGSSYSSSSSTSKFEVDGAATNKANTTGTSSVDFNLSNLGYATGSSVSVTNVKAGGTYSLAVNVSSTSIPSLTVSPLTLKWAHDIPSSKTATQHVMFTIVCISSYAYVYVTLFD